MKIDARKSSQDFKHPSGNRIYCHKEGMSGYAVGMNGTSIHFGCLTKNQAETKIKEICDTPQAKY